MIIHSFFLAKFLYKSYNSDKDKAIILEKDFSKISEMFDNSVIFEPTFTIRAFNIYK